jgi:hypothetical protein
MLCRLWDSVRGDSLRHLETGLLGLGDPRRLFGGRHGNNGSCG